MMEYYFQPSAIGGGWCGVVDKLYIHWVQVLHGHINDIQEGDYASGKVEKG